MPKGYVVVVAVSILALILAFVAVLRGRSLALGVLLVLIAVGCLLGLDIHRSRRGAIVLDRGGRRCPRCLGSGLDPQWDWFPLLVFGIILGSLLRREEPCPACGGTGRG